MAVWRLCFYTSSLSLFAMYYLTILVFLLTVAIASGGIVLSSQLKTRRGEGVFSTLLYFLSFYFTFGFYALWGRQLVVPVLARFVSPDIQEIVADIMVWLGSPFLVFASVMFIRLCREISGRKTRDSFVLVYVLASIVLIVAGGYTVLGHQEYPTVYMRFFFIVLLLVFTLLGGWFLLFPAPGGAMLRRHDRLMVAAVLLSLWMWQSAFLYLQDIHPVVVQGFIFIYFLYAGFLPVYLKYIARLPEADQGAEQPVSFDEFCMTHAISQREREIVAEICLGLSNQQIADRLFISLQTVKDHTHRIYGKTNCTSRSQLIRMVNECTKNSAQA